MTVAAPILRTKPAIKLPRFWKVIIHNDDVTPWMFVVQMLVMIFGKSFEDAYSITHAVHHQGEAVAGLFIKEVAETKITLSMERAKQQGHPLRLTMEPNE